MINVSILAEQNCIATGVYGTQELLEGANLFSEFSKGIKLFKPRIVSSDGKPVKAYTGTMITPAGSVAEFPDPDIIIIPAFFWDVNSIADLTGHHKEWITGQYRTGTTIAAMCTGVFALAGTGLLDNRQATTNWIFKNEFRKNFPDVLLEPEKMVTEEDNLVCSGAMAAYLRMILHLIEKFGSRELMLMCSKSILIDPGSKSQLPFMGFLPERTHGDEIIIKAQTLMEKKYNTGITITSIADNSGICLRHFRRRFKNATGTTPNEYLQTLRIEKAKKILENSDEHVSQISWQVGYEDTSSFSRSFKKQTGLSPKRYRETFGG